MSKRKKSKKLVQVGPNEWRLLPVAKGSEAEEIARRLECKEPRRRAQRRKRAKDNQEGIREA